MNSIGMQVFAGDSGLFINKWTTMIEGISGIGVDYRFNTGDKYFLKLKNAASKNFDCKQRVFDNFGFYGFEIKTIRNGIFVQLKNT